MRAWLASSLIRLYPASRTGRRKSLRLHAARGEQVSFQLAFRTGASDRKVEAAVAAPEPLTARVRRVGYVSVPHHNTDTPADELDGLGHIPGYVPDPLLPESTAHAGPHETNAFWITVRVPADASPKSYRLQLTLTAEGEQPAALTATIVAHPAVIRSRRDFPVTHWFYCDALCDWYRVEPFSEGFWPIIESYLADLSLHNLDTSHVPLFTPPTDGVKRPNQLLDVRRRGDRYLFDWTLVRRWVAAAKKHGLSRFEWPHLFTQWGAKYAIRIYQGHGGSEKLLWDPETPSASPVYRDFLTQFLPEFKQFLEAEDLWESSFFHLSDEPHGEEAIRNYRAARRMLHQLAPWMKVMDALSDISFAREGLVDTPIPLISVAPEFVREGYPAWVYFCPGPRGRYTQRLLDTPLVKTRMFGWLCYRNRARGFLHWGYNYWYQSQTRHLINPYLTQDALWWPKWPYGDAFVVYPGEDGPVDSLRWEVFAESLQDYALLQTAGLDPDDPALEAIQDYAEFPRDESWIAQRRADLLAALDAA
ncbi:MAG: DUF4091 domain-containing protein [Armatimonadota bacterium]|nr:MAG: DUF4091 domain-containing protein [Armatimonadota bacterium]